MCKFAYTNTKKCVTMKIFELAQAKETLINKATTKQGITKEVLLIILKELDMTLKELCSYIDISVRSIQLKKAEEQLPFGSSEKALLISKLYCKGIIVFGEKIRFIRWMNSNNHTLGGVKPKQYLGTYTGIEIISNQINAIDYGFVA